MPNMARLLHTLLLITLFSILITYTYSKRVDRKTYIVYMGDHPQGIDPASLPSRHKTMAQNVLGSDFAPGAILHSYWKSFNGFVVDLTEEEAKTMEGMDDVVSVFPNTKKKFHTTRSWDFIGFTEKVQTKSSRLARDIVVGVIDTGIWPESESFSGKGFGPPPSTWKGSCHNFTCNNKIIGAKYFRIKEKHVKSDLISPRDSDGHGTHTASTAAGNLVPSASLLGLGSGTARGGVPSARIAVYKVGWEEPGNTIDDIDVFAAFDEAIADGVDVISLSLGAETPLSYFKDSNAIGAFHALKKGILTSNSAGNDGPGFYTISTLAPWLLSVAATSIDRKFSTSLKLGNGLIFQGSAINTFDNHNQFYPLVDAADIPNKKFNSSVSRNCRKGSLNRALLKGKIILCDGDLEDEELSFVVAGVIITGPYAKDSPSSYPLPTTMISYNDGLVIRSYLNSTRNPMASILRSNEEKDHLAPYVASFSSRGPNPISPNILKPDISAPGVDIVAAWPPIAPVADLKGDKRSVKYNIISGTSMACPHATGAAAYVKSFHPHWSPSAIKSALITTAIPLSPALNPEAEFAYGAGLINPVKAVNPGLIYDVHTIDYVRFLCGQGYDKKKLRTVTGDNSTCIKDQENLELNLPTFASYRPYKTYFVQQFDRTVTNVGSSNSKYKAKVIAPSVLNIQVIPKVLSFTSLGEKKTFTVIIEGKLDVDILSASLIWDNGKVQVRSPIIVYSHRIAYHPGNNKQKPSMVVRG